MPDFTPGELVKLKLRDETKRDPRFIAFRHLDGRTVLVKGVQHGANMELLVRAQNGNETWIPIDDVEPLS